MFVCFTKQFQSIIIYNFQALINHKLVKTIKDIIIKIKLILIIAINHDYFQLHVVVLKNSFLLMIL
jgi:hypothetical protein